MKKKLLCCAMLGAMSMAQSAMAQDFDDRWYISGTVGVLNTDNDRNTGNGALFGIGVGKMVSPNVSVDIDLDRTNTTRDPLPHLGWAVTISSRKAVTGGPTLLQVSVRNETTMTILLLLTTAIPICL